MLLANPRFPSAAASGILGFALDASCGHQAVVGRPALAEQAPFTGAPARSPWTRKSLPGVFFILPCEQNIADVVRGIGLTPRLVPSFRSHSVGVVPVPWLKLSGFPLAFTVSQEVFPVLCLWPLGFPFSPKHIPEGFLFCECDSRHSPFAIPVPVPPPVLRLRFPSFPVLRFRFPDSLPGSICGLWLFPFLVFVSQEFCPFASSSFQVSPWPSPLPELIPVLQFWFPGFPGPCSCVLGIYLFFVSGFQVSPWPFTFPRWFSVLHPRSPRFLGFRFCVPESFPLNVCDCVSIRSCSGLPPLNTPRSNLRPSP